MTQVNPGVLGSTNSGGSVVVALAGNATIGVGTKAVATAGTRVQLSSISIPCKKVTIQASSTNTGNIYIGDVTVAASNGIFITPTFSYQMTPSNLNLVYLDADTNANSVTYLYEN
jgi:hypothetical protein